MIEGALLFAGLGCFAGLKLPLRVSLMGLPVALLVFAGILAVEGYDLGRIMLGLVVALVAAQAGVVAVVVARVVIARREEATASDPDGTKAQAAPEILERT